MHAHEWLRSRAEHYYSLAIAIIAKCIISISSLSLIISACMDAVVITDFLFLRFLVLSLPTFHISIVMSIFKLCSIFVQKSEHCLYSV